MKLYVCIMAVALCACLAQSSPFTKIAQKIGEKVGDVVKGSDEPKPEGADSNESGGLIDKMKDKAVDKAVALSLDKLGDAAVGDTEKVKIDGGIGQKVLGHVADAVITRGAEMAKSKSHELINSLDDPKVEEPKKPEGAEEVKQRRKRAIPDPTLPAKTGLMRNIMGHIKAIPSKMANLIDRNHDKLKPSNRYTTFMQEPHTSVKADYMPPSPSGKTQLVAEKLASDEGVSTAKAATVATAAAATKLAEEEKEEQKAESEEDEEAKKGGSDNESEDDDDDNVDKKDDDDNKKDDDDNKKDDDDNKKDDRKSEVKKENPSSE